MNSIDLNSFPELIPRRLDWDSAFFDMEVATLHITNVKDFNMPAFQAASAAYNLVYVFADELLDVPGLKLVDRKITLQYRVSTEHRIDKLPDFDVSPFDPDIHDQEELIRLALLSGVYSRFNLDKNFRSSDYERLYQAWILNSINGNFASEVFVASNADQLLGFITLDEKEQHTAAIGLLAVAENTRGKGIGTALIRHAVAKAQQASKHDIQVVTQGENQPALALYLKNNFHITQQINIYHYWNHDPI